MHAGAAAGWWLLWPARRAAACTKPARRPGSGGGVAGGRSRGGRPMSPERPATLPYCRRRAERPHARRGCARGRWFGRRRREPASAVAAPYLISNIFGSRGRCECEAAAPAPMRGVLGGSRDGYLGAARTLRYRFTSLCSLRARWPAAGCGGGGRGPRRPTPAPMGSAISS